jgi:hypothetical protein
MRDRQSGRVQFEIATTRADQGRACAVHREIGRAVVQLDVSNASSNARASNAVSHLGHGIDEVRLVAVTDVRCGKAQERAMSSVAGSAQSRRIPL